MWKSRIYFLTILCALISFALSLSAPLFINSTTPVKFKKLKECLVIAGIHIEDIVSRDSGAKFTDLNFQWNKLNGNLEPMAYLIANRVSEIQSAVICCRFLNIRIVPRSGGHSYVKNGFGDSHSLVVDLAKLNRISVDSSQMTNEIGSGARSGLISYQLWRRGFFIPLGICPTVGIAGLTLGGGYGYFTRQFGLTMDSLVGLEMVDAYGKLVSINASVNEDLFFALRGSGGGSYGIVTKFKFKMYSAPKSIVYGVYDYSFSDFSQFYGAWQSLITSDAVPNNLNTVIIMSVNNIKMYVIYTNVGNSKSESFKDVADVASLLRSFSFPSATISFVKLYSYAEFLVSRSQMYARTLLIHPYQLASITKHNEIGWKKVKSMYVDEILNEEQIAKYGILLGAYLRHANLSFEQNGGAINTFAPSETAFIHRGRNLYHIRLFALIPDGEDFSAADAAMKHFYASTRTILNHRESYQNYLDPEITSNDLRRYYGEHLNRLIQIKIKFDPDNVFRHPQSIPASFSHW